MLVSPAIPQIIDNKVIEVVGDTGFEPVIYRKFLFEQALNISQFLAISAH